MDYESEIVCVKCEHYKNGYCVKFDKEVYEDNWCNECTNIPF